MVKGTILQILRGKKYISYTPVCDTEALAHFIILIVILNCCNTWFFVEAPFVATVCINALHTRLPNFPRYTGWKTEEPRNSTLNEIKLRFIQSILVSHTSAIWLPHFLRGKQCPGNIYSELSMVLAPSKDHVKLCFSKVPVGIWLISFCI